MHLLSFLSNTYTKTLRRSKTYNENKQQLLLNHSDEDVVSISVSEDESHHIDKDHFYSLEVSDVMIPRLDIVALPEDSTIEYICELFVKSGHTRILVYKDDLDHILGYLHIKDVLKYIVKHNSESPNIKDMILNHINITPSTRLVTLLNMMKEKRTHIAVIIDEYGGTDGILTVEDIVKKLIGPIEDEHYREEKMYSTNDDGSIICSARMKIEDIESLIDKKLRNEDDDYDTIGGLILSYLGYMPEISQEVRLNDDIVIKILDADIRTLKKLKITWSGS